MLLSLSSISPRPSRRSPATAQAPDRSRARGLLAMVVCAIAALSLAGIHTRLPSEATAQMERLAVKIGQAKFIHPDTARHIERLMAPAQYDCAQVPCSPGLQHRNSIARSRLETLIAAKSRWNEQVASEHAHVRDDGARSTGQALNNRE